jgi:hypothetical protein
MESVSLEMFSRKITCFCCLVIILLTIKNLLKEMGFGQDGLWVADPKKRSQEVDLELESTLKACFRLLLRCLKMFLTLKKSILKKKKKSNHLVKKLKTLLRVSKA